MSKKTNKAAPKEVSSYAQRDIVLGKVRGFPPWPGMVVDPDSAPEIVQSERPFKRTNFYCVQFFPAGDYAWLLAKDISKLQTHEIESYINEPYKKSGDLLQGYRTALDPTAWEASRAAALAAAAAAASASAAAAADDEDAEAEGEAEEVDELDTDHEAGDGKKKPKNRKRKRESDSATGTTTTGAGGGKTRKPPKEKKEKQKKAPAKPRKSGAKTKALVESEDERAQEEEGTEDAEGEDAGPSKKTSPPPAKKARRDRAADKEKEDDPEDAKMQADPEALKVREWRHRLQKAFLSSKTTPEDADMPALDVLFSTVESYHAITVAYLQFSKIGKVMRHITLLPEDRVPRDAEFRFRERARALVERWQLVLGAGRGGEGAAAATTTTATSAKAALGGENGKEVNGKEEMKVNGMGGGAGVSPTQDTKEVTAGAAAIDLNGHADAGAGLVPAEVDAQDEADAQGQADAQGEVEVDAPAEVDVAMVEA